MDAFYYFLTSTNEEVQPPVEVNYDLWQIIFWYSAFVVAVLLFIIYLTSRKTNRKKMDAITSTLQKAINRVDNLLKNLKANVKYQRRVREEAHRISVIITSFDVTLIQLKEKTRLDEFDVIIAKCQGISKDLRKITENNYAKIIEDLESIQERIIALKGQVELIKTYLR